MTALHDLGLLLTQTAGALGPVGTLVLILFLLVYAGVVLPAVWSRRPYRRTAARRILTSLLDHLDSLLRARHGRGPQ